MSAPLHLSPLKTFSNPPRDLLTPDPGYSFDSVLFYGNFWSLFQLDLLLFAMVDLFAHNFLLAAIITYIVSWVRQHCYICALIITH